MTLYPPIFSGIVKEETDLLLYAVIVASLLFTLYVKPLTVSPTGARSTSLSTNGTMVSYSTDSLFSCASVPTASTNSIFASNSVVFCSPVNAELSERELSIPLSIPSAETENGMIVKMLTIITNTRIIEMLFFNMSIPPNIFKKCVAHAIRATHEKHSASFSCHTK